MTMKWRCTVCGYIHDGDTPPAVCPKCGSPAEKYEKVDEERAKLIDRSRYTNLLEVTLIELLDRVRDIGARIEQDALDPRCVALAKKVQVAAWELGQNVKAELEGHVQKGKWG